MPKSNPSGTTGQVPLYLLLGLGTGALVLGLTLGLTLGLATTIDSTLVFVSIAASIALFSAALLRVWRGQASLAAHKASAQEGTQAPKAAAAKPLQTGHGTQPTDSAKPGAGASAPDQGSAGPKDATAPKASAQLVAVAAPMVAPAVAPVVRSVVAPVVASEAPHEVPPKVTPEVKTAVAADHGQASQASGELTALLNLTIGDLLQAVLLKDPERVKRLKVQLEHSLEPMQDSQPQALAAGLPSAGTRPSESRPSHP